MYIPSPFATFRRPNRSIGLTNQSGLSDDQLRGVAPSIFADRPWHTASEKYAFIPTSAVVARLRQEGFVPIKAQQSLTRIPGKGDFTKHMLRFRRVGLPGVLSVGDTIPEIVIINSHDMTSSYEVSAGLWRLVCLNGMTVQDSQFGSIRTRHTGDIVGEVIDATYKIVDDFPALMDRVQTYKALPMPEPMQRAYAESAAMLRWDEAEARPIEPEQLLHVRRSEDRDPNLWLTYQRVQENLVKGGLRGRNRSNGRMSTRAINSVTEDVKLNKALWHLTESMARMMGQPAAA